MLLTYQLIKEILEASTRSIPALAGGAGSFSNEGSAFVFISFVSPIFLQSLQLIDETTH